MVSVAELGARLQGPCSCRCRCSYRCIAVAVAAVACRYCGRGTSWLINPLPASLGYTTGDEGYRTNPKGLGHDMMRTLETCGGRMAARLDATGRLRGRPQRERIRRKVSAILGKGRLARTAPPSRRVTGGRTSWWAEGDADGTGRRRVGRTAKRRPGLQPA